MGIDSVDQLALKVISGNVIGFSFFNDLRDQEKVPYPNIRILLWQLKWKLEEKKR